MKKIRKVAVLGLGYVGLPTLVAVTRAKRYETVGYDVSSSRIEQLKNGQSPIEDSDVVDYLKSGSLKVSDQASILKNTDVFIICVPTPVNSGYKPDYSFVLSAAKVVSGYITKGCHVVLESTVNPGTVREVFIPALIKPSKLDPESDFNVAHCPERINPGDRKWNIYNINRNIGSTNESMTTQLADFYQSFVTGAKINQVSSVEVAESTKIIENTFRDINIAFVNELARSFDAMGIDLVETINAASNKPFGYLPHYPGCGVGGHCIAVDPYYLIEKAAKHGFDHKFLKLAREINNNMPFYAVQKLADALNEVGLPLKGTSVGLFGLSYKPEIGDQRESPAYEIKHLLEKKKAKVVSYDPFIKSDAESLEEALEKCQAIVIATAHQEIVKKLPKLLKRWDNIKVIVDGRNCLLKDSLPSEIAYVGIGR